MTEEKKPLTDQDLAEIEARLKEATASEDWGKHGFALEWSREKVGRNASIWYGDGDQCAEVHGNLGLGINGDAVCKFFTYSIEDVTRLLAEVRRLQASNVAVKMSLESIVRHQDKKADELFSASVEIDNVRKMLADANAREQAHIAKAEHIKALVALHVAVLDWWEYRNEPMHGHSVPGIWDDDNGYLAGTRCDICAARAALEAAVNALFAFAPPKPVPMCKTDSEGERR